MTFIEGAVMLLVIQISDYLFSALQKWDSRMV